MQLINKTNFLLTKFQDEVEKLREEIRSFKKPFVQNRTNIIALKTVTIAIGTI